MTLSMWYTDRGNWVEAILFLTLCNKHYDWAGVRPFIIVPVTFQSLPFADGLGHVYDVWQVVQEDNIRLVDRDGVKGCLQTGQPINSRGNSL